MALGELNLPCEHCHENPGLQVENGCLKDSPVPDRWQIGKYKFQRCPGKLVTAESYEYIKAYNWMQRGFLPNPGGWMEQPAKFVRAMTIIDSELMKREKEEIEKIKRGAK